MREMRTSRRNSYCPKTLPRLKLKGRPFFEHSDLVLMCAHSMCIDKESKVLNESLAKEIPGLNLIECCIARQGGSTLGY